MEKKLDSRQKKGSTFQSRFALILFIQTMLILILWFHYHRISLKNVNKIAYQTVTLAAERLLSQISDELEYMRGVCGVIASSSSVKDFLQEDDVLRYYEKAITVSELVDKVAYPISASDSVIAIDRKGRYYRFSGGISNAACQLLDQTFRDAGVAYTIIQLEDTSYFCHSSPVMLTDQYKTTNLGNIMMLTDLSKTRRLLKSGSASDVDMMIINDDMVLLSNLTELEGQHVEDVASLYSTIVFTEVEHTDLVIGAAIHGNDAMVEKLRFIVLSFCVIGLMLISILLIYLYLSRSMIRPMASVFQGVNHIVDGNHRIKPTGRQDFDEPVGEINAMLDRTKRYHMMLLGKQINVHFIVNTLLYIQGLARNQQHKKAEMAAQELIKLIHHMHLGDASVNLFVEMEFVQSYISLMNIKHDNRFIVNYQVDDRLAEYLIPSFILQPIVENSLTHGLAIQKTDCILCITGTYTQDSIVMKVTDNGSGMEEQMLTKLNEKLTMARQGEFEDRQLHGIGLCNIQRRIHVLFGSQYGIVHVDSRPGEGTTVVISLPLHKDNHCNRQV